MKKNENMKKKKKEKNRPFLSHSGGGQETTFYLRVALNNNFAVIWRNYSLLEVIIDLLRSPQAARHGVGPA